METWNIFEETTGALADPDEKVLIDTGIEVGSFAELDRVISNLPGKRYRVIPHTDRHIHIEKPVNHRE